MKLQHNIGLSHKPALAIGALLMAANLLAAPAVAAEAPSQAHEAAVARMFADPAGAEAVLRTGTGATEKLDYALFLHAFRPHGPKTQARIERLIGDIRTAIAAKGEYWGKGSIAELRPYDGSDSSLVPVIQAAAVSDVSESYEIPCGVLQKRPALLDATAPMYGGNGDNFLPRSGCQGERGNVAGYPDKLVKTYVDLADRADGCIGCGTGTIRFSLGAAANLAQERMRLDPRYFLSTERAFDKPKQAYPYQAWSYLSISNRRLGKQIEASFQRTRAGLVHYYRGLGLSQKEAQHAATQALFSASFGANCGGRAAVKVSLRTLVLDGATPGTIRSFIKSGKWKTPERDAIARCRVYGGMDPMAHIALHDPAVFEMLEKLSKNLTPAEQEMLDLQMNVDEPNDFGKTPLMTAAQFGLGDSANYLLDRGATVNAVTGGGWLHADNRTALHYAAASGSLPLIRLLVSRGADISAKDTAEAPAYFFGVKDTPGNLRPIDYLNGTGPVPPINSLSRDDRTEAARLLGQP